VLKYFDDFFLNLPVALLEGCSLPTGRPLMTIPLEKSLVHLCRLFEVGLSFTLILTAPNE
jgi:hypothetical protein